MGTPLSGSLIGLEWSRSSGIAVTGAVCIMRGFPCRCDLILSQPYIAVKPIVRLEGIDYSADNSMPSSEK